MTLAEALETLRTDIHNASQAARVLEAQDTLHRELQRLVRRVTQSSEYWEPAALSVADKLVDQALSGDLPEIPAPALYVRTALRWRVLDLVRRAEVAKRDIARQEMQAAIDAADAEAAKRREVAWTSLRAMYAIVRRALEERFREPNDVAMETLWHIHERGLTLKEVLVRLDPGLEVDEVALERAAARLHKAQQRLRAAIKAEAAAQVAAGRLPEETGEDILWLLATLRRRRPIALASSVSPT
ncbi:hypothetical protein LBMAG42_56220 [Deltaproteobacteria bacterium]|nr:hypothetical protein LBMAG42_56220 [Deltaproteobacteria bacterium]